MNDQILKYINNKTNNKTPEIGIILGSGLSYFAQEYIENPIIIPYHEIPDFPISTVPGHAGNLVFGNIGKRSIICLQGRFHLYEGYNAHEVTIPVRLAKELGISTLIVTNAAGGIRGGMTPGEIMFIEDHINFLGENPLIGQKNVPDDKRFPDMTNIYDERIIKLGLDICDAKNIKATRGIYLATKGPSFETPAEIRAFKTLGADAVGMSTVPEVIVARQEGLTICGISCISNLAAGISKNPLSHEEVGETIQKIQTSFADMLTDLIKQL